MDNIETPEELNNFMAGIEQNRLANDGLEQYLDIEWEREVANFHENRRLMEFHHNRINNNYRRTNPEELESYRQQCIKIIGAWERESQTNPNPYKQALEFNHQLLQYREFTISRLKATLAKIEAIQSGENLLVNKENRVFVVVQYYGEEQEENYGYVILKVFDDADAAIAFKESGQRRVIQVFDIESTNLF